MRKKLQDKMFEASYIFELIISVLVGIGILIFAFFMAKNMISIITTKSDVNALVGILDDAITLAIGAELIKMLCKHTPETVIEVLAFALARQLIIGHGDCWNNLITVISIAVLFLVRRFLLKNHDMIETPDGLVEIDTQEDIRF